MSLSSPNSLSVRNKRLSLSPSPSLSCTFFRPSPSPNLVHRTSNKRLSLAQLSGSNKPLSRARAFNEQQHRSLYFIHSLFWSSLNLVINVSLSRSWRMSARVALSSRLSPSLLEGVGTRVLPSRSKLATSVGAATAVLAPRICWTWPSMSLPRQHGHVDDRSSHGLMHLQWNACLPHQQTAPARAVHVLVRAPIGRAQKMQVPAPTCAAREGGWHQRRRDKDCAAARQPLRTHAAIKDFGSLPLAWGARIRVPGALWRFVPDSPAFFEHHSVLATLEVTQADGAGRSLLVRRAI
jgi:hypothetical protein